MSKCRKTRPCGNCPWRVGSDTATIPGFGVPLMQNLARTCVGDGIALMACHKSTEGDDVVCAGFVLSVGMDSIALRIAASRGTIDPQRFEANGELHPDFPAMLRAHGVKPVGPYDHNIERLRAWLGAG